MSLRKNINAFYDYVFNDNQAPVYLTACILLSHFLFYVSTMMIAKFCFGPIAFIVTLIGLPLALTAYIAVSGYISCFSESDE